MDLSTILWAVFLAPFLLFFAYMLIGGWLIAGAEGGIAGLLFYWPVVFTFYWMAIGTAHWMVFSSPGIRCFSSQATPPLWLRTVSKGVCIFAY